MVRSRGVDLKEFSGVHTVPSCLLEDGADDDIVQVTHASAEREGEGKGRLHFHDFH
jgi:hypothetical protein